MFHLFRNQLNQNCTNTRVLCIVSVAYEILSSKILLPTAREGNVFTNVCRSFCSQSASWLLCHLPSLLERKRKHSSRICTTSFSGHHQLSVWRRGPQMNKFEQASSDPNEVSLVRGCPGLMSRVGREGEGGKDGVPSSDVQRGTPPDFSEGVPYTIPIALSHDAFDATL